LYGCCKSKSRCCICCNGCTLILQMFVPNVSSVFQTYVASVFHLDVAYVSHICCKCLIWILCMFAMATHVFFLVFHTNVASVSIVSDVCCNCFIQMLQK
jgi:hypothetical protein